MEEMPKNYDPSTNEPAILQKWLDGGYYTVSYTHLTLPTT